VCPKGKKAAEVYRNQLFPNARASRKQANAQRQNQTCPMPCLLSLSDPLQRQHHLQHSLSSASKPAVVTCAEKLSMKTHFVQDTDFLTTFTSPSIFFFIYSPCFFFFLVSQVLSCVTSSTSDPPFPSISSLTHSNPKKEPIFLRHSRITTSFAAT